jgi:hypothetical protein
MNMARANFKTIIILAAATLLFANTFSQTTQVTYLSGTGSDNTVEWEFMVSGGRQSGVWARIPVPSNWEMQGFGTYHYYEDWISSRAPDSVAFYRHRFVAPAAWKNKKIDIVFDGSMTDTEAKINGRLAGPVHQGGFYQFRYDITALLRFGKENLLEVKVCKFSANTSINRAERKADFWIFGGIFRPVWLEIFPSQHIVRTAIDARHSGDFAIDVFLEGIVTADSITGLIVNLDGTPVGAAFSGAIKPGLEIASLRAKAEGIKPWSPEWPYRYRAQVQLKEKGRTIHEVAEILGFRTIQVRPHDGLYVNDVRVHLKGVNRHSLWPTTGRTTSKTISLQDANLIKDMNMNAVRMSHYPPDAHFLDAADSLGLFVIDELTGWQAKYDTDVGEKLVRELVLRDINHPSVIMWANGNEGGFNFDLVHDYAEWDPQERPVIHPWLNWNGINTAHYEVYDCCTGTFFHGNDLIMPTEFLHGLYDGGGGAGLDDWWNLMLRTPLAVGGFLWSFADEGIVRTDKNNIIDTDGNHGPDGVVGPYREKEGSFYAIKEIWSPIYFNLSERDKLPPTFTGAMHLENRYDFTNLSQVRFSWALVDFATPGSGQTGHTVAAEGVATSPNVLPHNSDSLFINLPADWRQHDAFSLTAADAHGREIYTWSWVIPGATAVAQRLVQSSPGSATGVENNDVIIMKAKGTETRIDRTTGQLASVYKNGTSISLQNGPRLVSGEATLTEIKEFADGNDYVVVANYAGNLRSIRWRMQPGGWLRLDYAYQFPGHTEMDYLGVTFDYPEDHVTGLRWLGKGPYRVWKNRLKGTEFDVWHKAYNDAITGYRWEYPEFKGFHGNVYWAILETKEMPITMVFATEDLFLRVLTPKEPEGEFFNPMTTHVDFPAGDLSFLHGIAPIGTKFHKASELGPAGQPNLVPRLGQTFEGTVYFYFGSDLPITTGDE